MQIIKKKKKLKTIYENKKIKKEITKNKYRVMKLVPHDSSETNFLRLITKKVKNTRYEFWGINIKTCV